MPASRNYPKVTERVSHILRRDFLARCFGMGAVLAVLLVSAACATSAPSPIIAATRDDPAVASPRVVATAYTALLIGELVHANNCLQVKSSLSDATFTLAWPPDTGVIVADGDVKVTTGIVRGQPETVILHFGDVVRIGGGETRNLSEQLRDTVGEGCQGPYWVVGFEIDRDPATTEP